jgi:hypothetical protein
MSPLNAILLQEFLAALDMYCSHLDLVLGRLDKLEADINAEYERIIAEGNYDPEYSDVGDIAYKAEKNVLGKDTLFDPPFQNVAAIASYCVLVYHLFERYLEETARRKGVHKETKDFSLKTFLEYFGEFSNHSNRPKLDELYLVANYCKHGRGSSEEKLREQRPDYFRMSDHELWQPKPIFDDTTLKPLSGYDINIKRADFGEYVKAVKAFVTDVYSQLG